MRLKVGPSLSYAIKVSFVMTVFVPKMAFAMGFLLTTTGYSSFTAVNQLVSKGRG